MKKTYQPFIIKRGDEILNEMGKEIKITNKSREYLYNLLTQKFIEGKISDGDVAVFDSDEEFEKFLTFCNVQEDLEHLYELGLIGSFDDKDSFFLTEKGKEYAKKAFIDGTDLISQYNRVLNF